MTSAIPESLTLAGTFLGHSLPHSSIGSAFNSEADCVVDGNRYPRTADGINAALAACSPGTTHLSSATYNNLTSSIKIDCGQSLVFEGNPRMSFSLGNAVRVSTTLRTVEYAENSSTGPLHLDAANVPATSDLQYRGVTNATSFRPLYSQAFSSLAPNSATRGAVRLGSTDSICWRNNGNTADLCIGQTSSDRFAVPWPLLDTNLITPKIASGSPINSVYRASGLLPESPFTSISAQACQDGKFKLRGAAVTGVVAVSPATDRGSPNLLWSASVSGPDTVAIRLCNLSTVAITPPRANWNLVVVQ
jgi:hypothetical protein